VPHHPKAPLCKGGILKFQSSALPNFVSKRFALATLSVLAVLGHLSQRERQGGDTPRPKSCTDLALPLGELSPQVTERARPLSGRIWNPTLQPSAKLWITLAPLESLARCRLCRQARLRDRRASAKLWIMSYSPPRKFSAVSALPLLQPPVYKKKPAVCGLSTLFFAILGTNRKKGHPCT